MISYTFPEGFRWGAATAAYQIEGAHDEDGRAPSVWDTFCAIPGRVHNNETGMVACDHYHRVEQDVNLMAELGITDYRFSISWPRIVPQGSGAVNQRGVDFYKRLLDALQNKGITPHATLFHWDTPQALEDRYGSWRDRRMAADFADYCSVVVRNLGDRIADWMTMNEIMCFTKLAYGVGRPGDVAPGVAVKTRKEIQQTVHHALLGHGLAAQAIRAATPRPCRVALVENLSVPVPVSESPEHIAAAGRAFRQQNGDILIPVLTGTHDPGRWKDLGEAAPDIAPGDMETIRQPLDRLGINVYTGNWVRAAGNERGFQWLPWPTDYPRLNMPWLHFLPDALYWAPRHLAEELKLPELPVVVTENGCACKDSVDAQGEIIDLDRILYLREYLRALHRAAGEGYRVEGYFVWSLMDNFEWAHGYDKRFGLIRVDYGSQKRTPKQSFRFYADCIRHRRVV